MNFNNLNLLNLLYLPLMVVTVVELKRDWKSVWDAQLTTRDRYILQRLVIFLCLPLVVMCHELGHVMAITQCGGHVQEFHYGFFWGYVVPVETFPPAQTLWIYLSGNLVQILIGLVSLGAAAVCTSPPVVAMLVYLYFWSVGGTALVYALMSFSGLYGDWIAIYRSPLLQLVVPIGIIHLLLAAFLIWTLYGRRPRRWFAQKTVPGFKEKLEAAEYLLASDPGPANWIKLGWVYVSAGLLAQGKDCLEQVSLSDPGSPEAVLLGGAINMRQGDLERATVCYRQVANASGISGRVRAQALLLLGEAEQRSGQADSALATYGEAIEADPGLADGHYYRALLLMNAGQSDEAETELMSAEDKEWLDRQPPGLASRNLRDLFRGPDKPQ